MKTAKAFNIQILILHWVKKLNGLQEYQQFVFEAAQPGIVKAQLVANGSYTNTNTEFTLLKTRKASVSEITKKKINYRVDLEM